MSIRKHTNFSICTIQKVNKMTEIWLFSGIDYVDRERAIITHNKFLNSEKYAFSIDRLIESSIFSCNATKCRLEPYIQMHKLAYFFFSVKDIKHVAAQYRYPSDLMIIKNEWPNCNATYFQLNNPNEINHLKFCSINLMVIKWVCECNVCRMRAHARTHTFLHLLHKYK